MRQSQKAWVWRSIPALGTWSPTEAYASAKGSLIEDQREILILKGRSRNLLPRN